MNLTRIGMTQAGLDLLARSQMGETLTITRLALGSGVPASDQSILEMIQMVQLALSLPDITLQKVDPSACRVQAVFDSDDVPSGLLVKELGVFAKIEQEPEILYAYGCDDTEGENLPPHGGAVIYERTITAQIQVGDADRVQAQFDSGVKVTHDQLNIILAEYQHMADKDQPNGYAGLDGDGEIPIAPIDGLQARNLWNALVELVNQNRDLQNQVDVIAMDLATVLDVLFADITANPYLVTFSSLGGLVVDGVWNAALQRIEF